MKYLLTFLIALLFSPIYVFGAEIYFQSSKNEFDLNQEIKLPIYINSDKESINTVDLEIYFNNELLEFSGYIDNQDFNKKYFASPYSKDNKIYLTFIIPNGVSGIYDPDVRGIKDLHIVDLLFKTKKPGQASFIFVKNDILKNDGLGNSLALNKKDLSITIRDNISQNKDLSVDNKPPLAFEISFIKGDKNNNIDDILVFSTTDQETGIKEYKIKKWNKWEAINSPYILDTVIFSKKITIRAYDFENNFVEENIEVDGLIDFDIFILILLFFIFASFFGYKLIK